MFPKSSIDMKYLSIAQLKPTVLKTESTFNIIDEERDSPAAIIKFINKKIIFKSKFDKKGSDEFLASKDMALSDVILDDEIEEESENDSCNSITFMKKFTFNKEKNLVNYEKNMSAKNPKRCLLDAFFKSNKSIENNYNLDSIEKKRKI